PQWSPDGTQIVYNIDNRLTDLDSGVWVMNADGTKQRRLTSDDGRNPQWSPDGTQITFHNDYGDVFLINVDPPNLPQLLVGNGWDPVWSPSALTGS
ncbi:MAG: S9 family peptidase, partial [bacterium]|nr:S9 family peptidase [bacterium]